MRQRFTNREIRARRLRLAAACAAAVALAVAALLCFAAASDELREQGAASLRASVLNCARQCAAIEGSYPPSLSYLEQNYGLVVNHRDYAVFYDAFAENVLPNVVVTPR